MCDILYTMFARQHVPVPYIWIAYAGAGAHMRSYMWGTHGAAHCAPLHVRTSSRVCARKRPRANSQFRYVALPFLVSAVVTSCTSCVIGFVWNSSNSSVGKCSVVVCNSKAYCESPRHTPTYLSNNIKWYIVLMRGVIKLTNEHNSYILCYCLYYVIQTYLNIMLNENQLFFKFQWLTIYRQYVMTMTREENFSERFFRGKWDF